MRKVILTIILAGALVRIGHAQTVNWPSLKNERFNVAYASYGYDFGVAAQAGYGRFVPTIRPLLITLDYSMPMGGRWTDDFKLRLGAHVEFFEKNGFAVSGKAMGNFRRHQTSLVRMASFGGEFALIAGYFRPTYHAALEVGGDGAVVTHLRHSRLMKSNFPEIHDGWYLNAGAHYFYGIQVGKNVGKQYEINLRLGKTNARGGHEDVLPVYAQLSVTKRF
jgi:hypothetical protein